MEQIDLMTARRRIAILMHEKDGEHTIHQYVITLLADHWREDGHEVFFLFGTKRFVPADLIIVHVDLSVVPDSYLRFAARYPVAVNGRVRDIRKSTFSTGLLRPDDLWQGPVIVKSDFNYAGEPERLREEPRVQSPLRRLWTSVRADRQRPPTEAFFETSGDYRVYDRIDKGALRGQFCAIHAPTGHPVMLRFLAGSVLKGRSAGITMTFGTMAIMPMGVKSLLES